MEFAFALSSSDNNPEQNLLHFFGSAALET